MKIGIDRRGKNQFGILNPCWKGGKSMSAKGYVLIRMPNHPKAQPNGYVFEHIIVMEKKLGRPLSPKERVHHKNEIKTDNSPENLELKQHGEHTSLHWDGKHHTQESKEKISLSKIGIACPESARLKHKENIALRQRDLLGRLVKCV